MYCMQSRLHSLWANLLWSVVCDRARAYKSYSEHITAHAIDSNEHAVGVNKRDKNAEVVSKQNQPQKGKKRKKEEERTCSMHAILVVVISMLNRSATTVFFSDRRIDSIIAF